MWWLQGLEQHPCCKAATHRHQCHLDHQGASDLIVDLVIKSSNNTKIFAEVVELGIALLEGGNQDIQKTVYAQLHTGETGQSFFKVCFDFLCMYGVN